MMQSPVKGGKIRLPRLVICKTALIFLAHGHTRLSPFHQCSCSAGVGVAHLLGEGPQELQVVRLEAALGRQDLEHALHLVHVLALVQVRAQQRLHDVGLHQPLHALLQAHSETMSQRCIEMLALAAPEAHSGAGAGIYAAESGPFLRFISHSRYSCTYHSCLKQLRVLIWHSAACAGDFDSSALLPHALDTFAAALCS